MNKDQEKILKIVKRNQYFLIILIIILLGPEGITRLLASTPMITGLYQTQIEEVRVLEPQTIFAIFFAVGALVYNVWGIFTASKKKGFKFSIKKTLITVVPPLALAFLAGYTNFFLADQTSDYILTILAGFGWAKAQNKVFKNS